MSSRRTLSALALALTGALTGSLTGSPAASGLTAPAPAFAAPEVGTTVGGAPAATTAAATRVKRVRPVDSTGRPKSSMTTARSFAHGSCAAGSEATGNAYRCFAGRFVLDPCWVQHDKRFVTCWLRPWRHRVMRIHVTKGYSGGRPAQSLSQPWAAATTGGRNCLRVQGASGEVGGKRITYRCGPNYGLAGTIDKRTTPWRAELVRRVAGGQYVADGTAELRKAWFGKRSRTG